ncbi:DNA alkylation repair protein [Enterovibrio paralichthyis]|uniref:DNA alkylation repair protein n=1 Tax=Enterovibrio paralichthyis TaxID=2853805 RepID=UPI001C465FEC|nr:DNA alkylation repair protein [Enterovibrio paralichthyis]MBV7297700.1 DNA alkylation repair protein [Enterovibrio paralichthyis]
METAETLIEQFTALGDPKIAAHSARFFKSGLGEYGHGDKFLGIRVPEIRHFAKAHRDVSLKSASILLKSEWHEVRLLALIMLSEQFKTSSADNQKVIYDFYLSRTEHINNWDLVDCSAHIIVGGHLLDQGKEDLYTLANSQSLWERRIAMMATFAFVRNNQYSDTMKLAQMLLEDKEDLIHKVSGWMLREVGKRDTALLRAFLDAHMKQMPRTMLRYAIEKFDDKERRRYLAR